MSYGMTKSIHLDVVKMWSYISLTDVVEQNIN